MSRSAGWSRSVDLSRLDALERATSKAIAILPLLPREQGGPSPWFRKPKETSCGCPERHG